MTLVLIHARFCFQIRSSVDQHFGDFYGASRHRHVQRGPKEVEFVDIGAARNQGLDALEDHRPSPHRAARPHWQRASPTRSEQQTTPVSDCLGQPCAPGSPIVRASQIIPEITECRIWGQPSGSAPPHREHGRHRRLNFSPIQQSICGSRTKAAASIGFAGSPAISSTSLFRIAVPKLLASLTTIMKAPGPPMTQSS